MPEFNPDAELGHGASVGTRWKNWFADFDMFLLAIGVIITDTKRQRALLLYQAGARVRDIFKQLPDTGEGKDYDIAKAKLLAHFEPQENRRFNVIYKPGGTNPAGFLSRHPACHTRIAWLKNTSTSLNVPLPPALCHSTKLPQL
jgi:hypothetical protein